MFTSTGPTFLLRRFNTGFKRELDLADVRTATHSGRNVFLMNEIGEKIYKVFVEGKTSPKHMKVMNDIANTLMSLRTRHYNQDDCKYNWMATARETGMGAVILVTGERRSGRVTGDVQAKKKRKEMRMSIYKLYLRLRQVEKAVHSMQLMQGRAMMAVNTCRASVHMVAFSVGILTVRCIRLASIRVVVPCRESPC